MRTFTLRVGIVAAVSLIAGLAVAQEPPPPSTPGSKPAIQTGPNLGGASNISYYRVGASEFLPNFVPTTFSRDGADDRIYSLTPGSTYFYANPHLPGGAVVKSIEFDSCDTNLAGNHMEFVFAGHDYHGNLTESLATLSSAGMIEDCGFVNQTGLNYVVDNNFKVLSLSVRFTAGNNTNKLAGAIIGYQLQVSPAPASASFTDVPVGSLYFQFVEALVDSGVTAGCGGGKYCPDSPLTRGQMAVFLSKALGLSWSQ